MTTETEFGDFSNSTGNSTICGPDLVGFSEQDCIRIYRNNCIILSTLPVLLILSLLLICKYCFRESKENINLPIRARRFSLVCPCPSHGNGRPNKSYSAVPVNRVELTSLMVNAKMSQENLSGKEPIGVHMSHSKNNRERLPRIELTTINSSFYGSNKKNLSEINLSSNLYASSEIIHSRLDNTLTIPERDLRNCCSTSKVDDHRLQHSDKLPSYFMVISSDSSPEGPIFSLVSPTASVRDS